MFHNLMPSLEVENGHFWEKLGKLRNDNLILRLEITEKKIITKTITPP